MRLAIALVVVGKALVVLFRLLFGGGQ